MTDSFLTTIDLFSVLFMERVTEELFQQLHAEQVQVARTQAVLLQLTSEPVPEAKHLFPPPQFQTHSILPLQRGTMPSTTAPIEHSFSSETTMPTTLAFPALTLRTVRGNLTVPLDSIIACEAAGKESIVHLLDGAGGATELVAFHLLKDIEALLEAVCRRDARFDTLFMRCHRSALVNLAHCTSWRKEGCCAQAMMRHGKEIPVAKERKKCFSQAFARLYPTHEAVVRRKYQRKTP